MRRILVALLLATPVFAQDDLVTRNKSILLGRGSATTGSVVLFNAGHAYSLTIQAPAGMSANRSLSMPANSGSSGECLQSDGAGGSSWVSCYTLAGNLLALSNLVSAADKIPYWTGSGTAANADFTAAGRSMVGAASATAQTALLNALVGDSGAGGLKGLAPAPASGDALKFLRGDATWQTVDTTITDNSTATSGCTTAGGVLTSVSNVVQCAEGLAWNSATLGATATSATPTFRLTASGGGYIELGYNTVPYIGGSGSNVFVQNAMNVLPWNNLNAAMGASAARWSTVYAGAINASGASTLSGATLIGDASLGSTVVPLTSRLGTGSTANIQEWQNSVGTNLAYVTSGGTIFSAAIGTAALPAYMLTETGMGLYRISSGVMGLAVGSSTPVGIHAGLGLSVRNGYYIGFSADATPDDLNAFFYSPSAATIQMGSTITSGSAINQTFRSHNATTGTNISGGNLTLVAPGGTGSSTGGTIAFQTAPVLASGTTAQTPVDRLTIAKDGGINLLGTTHNSGYSDTPSAAASQVFSYTYSNIPVHGLIRSVNTAGARVWNQAVTTDGVTFSAANDAQSSSISWLEVLGSSSAITSVTIPRGATTIGGSAVTGTTVPLTVNNGTSTGNILNLQDNGTNVFTVADGGDVLLYDLSSTNLNLSVDTWGVGETGTLGFLANSTQIGKVQMISDTSAHVDMLFSGWKNNIATEFLRFDAETNIVKIPNGGGLQLATGTKPTCDSSTRGTQFYVAGGAGVADTMEVCAKATTDLYAWYPMATIP